MDSPSVRSEKRFITWLERKYDKTKEIKSGFIRKLLKRLNALIKNKDTSVFADEELFEIYEEIAFGLAELPLGDDNGRRRIAGAGQRIGKLLGLDKITKEE